MKIVMKLKNHGLIIGLAIIVFACREGITEFVDDVDFIRTGQVTDALYFSNLARPDSIIIETNHKEVRLMDLNNNGINEFELISEEDTISINDGNQNSRVYHIKSLHLKKLTEDIFVSVESMTYTGYVEVIQGNTILNFDSQIWTSLDSVKVLCYWEKYIQSEFSYDYGFWNNKRNKYIAVHYQHEGRTIIAWIELSVVGYDNYILHNYASFILE